MSRAFFEVVTPATFRVLAPIETLRVAAGLAEGDASRDAVLSELGERVSDEVATACRIAAGSGFVPTLAQETVRDTFEASGDEVLILSRRHDVELVSVTIADNAITLDGRSLQSEAGLLYRWQDGRRLRWTGNEIVVTYKAGFAEDKVPSDLVGVVTDGFAIRRSQASVDPLVKSVRIEVEGIDTVQTDRWVGGVPGSSSTGLPADMIARLTRFMNPVT